MPAAARITDDHACPATTGALPHRGGPVLPPCSLNVKTNRLNQARATDKAICAGPPDFIVTGSLMVHINGKPAARVTDKTMHGGTITVGSGNVNIGGPAQGVMLGNPDAAFNSCLAMANGRSGNASSQSYNNCGVEASRLVINQQPGKNVGEDALLDEAFANDDASEPGKGETRRDAGGTSPNQRRAILGRNGVAATNQDANWDSITQAVAEKRGVITAHWAGVLWGTKDDGGHAINVTGLQYDNNGTLINVITADSAQGCYQSVPAWRFFLSLRSGRDMTVTDNPVWP